MGVHPKTMLKVTGDEVPVPRKPCSKLLYIVSGSHFRLKIVEESTIFYPTIPIHIISITYVAAIKVQFVM